MQSLHRYPVKSCLAAENSLAEILQAPKPSRLSAQGIASAQVLCVEAWYFVTFSIFGLDSNPLPQFLVSKPSNLESPKT